jgi:hypothetical protein
LAEQGSITSNFIAGQTPVRMRGRYDHPLYLNGAEELLNVIPTPGGSLIRRPGTKTIIAGASSISETSRMIEFQDQDTNGALLIFQPATSTNNLQVFQDDALVKTLTHPYGSGAIDLHAIDFVKVQDYMFFAHRDYAPQMFIKERTETLEGDGVETVFDFPYPVPDTADIIVKVDSVLQVITTDYTVSTFDLVDGQYIGVRITFTGGSVPPDGDSVEIIRDWGWHVYPNLDGPWEQQNTDQTHKVAISAIFTDESADGDGYFGAGVLHAVAKKGKPKTWFNDSWVGRDIRVYSDDGGSPIAEEAYATVSIDSITTTKQTYVCTVSEQYPMASESALATGKYSPRTHRWALSAWYTGQYPEVVGVHQDSLWFGRDNTRWKTVSGSLFQFSPTLPDDEGAHQVTADASITATSSDPVASSPSWLFGDKVLFNGTDANQFTIQGTTAFGAIAPSTVSIIKQNTVGAAKIKPIAMNAIYFVDNLRQNIYSMDFKFQTSSYPAEKANNFDDQLFYKRIRRLVLLTQPFTMMWAVMEDGTVINITNNEIDNNYAPSKLNFAFSVMDISVLRQSDGTESVYLLSLSGGLYKLGAFGTFEGDTRSKLNLRNTTYLSTDFYHVYTQDVETELYTDAATLYAAAASIDLNTIGTTKVVVDDTNYENWVYQSASTTVTPTNIYEIGTPFTVRVKLNKVQTVQGNLTDVNRKRKLKKVMFDLYKTLNFLVKEVSSTSDPEEIKMREGLSDLTAPPATFSGLKSWDYRSNRQNTLQLEITQDESVPFTLNSIVYEYDI